MPRGVLSQFFFENCLFGGAAVHCTARQMRNGFLLINMVVWVLIIIALRTLVLSG